MNMSESLTSELWLKIDQLHLKYLQSKDTPVKLEIRKKLEGESKIIFKQEEEVTEIKIEEYTNAYLNIFQAL